MREETYNQWGEMEQPDQFVSTPGAFDDLIESPGWVDVKRSIEARITALQESLEIEADFDMIRIQQGEIQGLRRVLDLPEILKDIVKQNTEEEGNG